MAAIASVRTRPRVRLSKDRVLRAAIQIADKAGIDSLTMRKLAQKLGIEAMTLYYYFAKKDDIVDGILYLERATFVTGEVLHIDGGQSAGD